ncbi:hypothetical protein ACFTS5_32700 [Nocardia sp. NPDC056952]|uniref:hypothetical protein n=1 Tax=Nocardia sp. NPDC056952 TaxID=3345979 RepID=UPI00362DA00D
MAHGARRREQPTRILADFSVLPHGHLRNVEDTAAFDVILAFRHQHSGHPPQRRRLLT